MTNGIDQHNWLDRYREILATIGASHEGDPFLAALTADFNEAWLHALENWNTAPERFHAIQNEWLEAVRTFYGETESIPDPMQALGHLRKLHQALKTSLLAAVEETPRLSVSDRRLLRFGVRHLINALAPENWPLANKEVIQTAFESGGASFMQGMKQFCQDLADSRMCLNVKTAGSNDFRVGETLALTPGEIIYESKLLQLIQYYPFSQKVMRPPLLMIPPWINKYYILDITPADSFVQWSIRQGHTVFMISWVNPDDSLKDLSFSDYLTACVEVMREVSRITGERHVNVLGYCIGGLLAACLAAYLADDDSLHVRTLTTFNALLDYSDPGEVGVFLSNRMLAAVEATSRFRDIFDGQLLYQTFTMMREDRMFWPYVVNNYFLGRPPAPNPLLFWNSDSTNLTYPMLLEYLRQMYGNNSLANGGDFVLAGKRIDLGRVRAPVYLLACRKDHIVPWNSVYSGSRLFESDVCFVLANAGHIVGVVNPPSSNRYSYWTSTGAYRTLDAAQWLEQAEQHPGSWWAHWHQWLRGHQPDELPARFPGSDGREILESAPGSYVLHQVTRNTRQ